MLCQNRGYKRKVVYKRNDYERNIPPMCFTYVDAVFWSCLREYMDMRSTLASTPI